MTTYFRHPGYDPPDFAGHWQEHGQPVELSMEGDRIVACSICDPMIEAQRYAHNEKVRRDEIEAPLLARIAEVEAERDSRHELAGQAAVEVLNLRAKIARVLSDLTFIEDHWPDAVPESDDSKPYVPIARVRATLDLP